MEQSDKEARVRRLWMTEEERELMQLVEDTRGYDPTATLFAEHVKRLLPQLADARRRLHLLGLPT